MVWIYDKELETSVANRAAILALAYFKNIRRHVVKLGFTNLTSVDGRHRSGKSLAAILISYLLDPTFFPNFDKRVVSNPEEYINAVISIRDKNIKGACIVVDEAGVSMASADFYEDFMKTITKMIQMYGYLCIQTFFCAPNKDFVDSRIRKMFHNYYRVERFSNEYCVIFPYSLKYSSMFRKWKHKAPIINFQGEKIVLNRIKIMKPPEFLIKKYKEFSDAHKDKMLNDFMMELHNQKMQAARRIVNIEDLLKNVINDPKPYLKTTCAEGEYYFDEDRIAHNLKIKAKLAKSIRFDAESYFQKQALLNPPKILPQTQIVKRKVGRPPGSRNKPKTQQGTNAN